MANVNEMTMEQVTAEIKEIAPTLKKAFEEAGALLDASKVTVFGDLDERGKSERMANMNARLTELGERRKALTDADQGRKAVAEAEGWLNAPVGTVPGTGGQKAYTPFAAAAMAKSADWLDGPMRGRTANVGIDVKDYLDREVKTVMSTGAGFEPQAIRSGLVVPAAFQRPSVIDIVPIVRTSQVAYVFMEQTTRTNNAAEIAESVDGNRASNNESAFEYTERSEPVRKISHILPVTDEQLEDIDGIADLLNNDMRSGVRERLSSQILNGGGMGDLNGLLSGSRSATDVNCSGMFFADAIAKLIESVQTTGFTEPDYFVAHPSDWWTYRTATTQDGVYLAGAPSANVPVVLWGYPGILTTEITSGNALAGNFGQYARLAVKRDVEVLIASENRSDFEEGVKTIKAEMRGAFAVLRRAAFAQTDDI